MSSYSSIIIDISSVPVPTLIDPQSFEELFDEYVQRYLTRWNELRAIDPTLPQYDVENLQTDPQMIAGQAWSDLRLTDRQFVIDAIKSLLAAFAEKTSLDALVARNSVQRKTIFAGDETTPAIMETDEHLLYRYLLSFDGKSAGSRERYLFEAHSALPYLEIGNVEVLGRKILKRRGDVDIVACGPLGRNLTNEELASLRSACLADKVVPETTEALVKPAKRSEYEVRQKVFIKPGVSPDLIATEVTERIRRVTNRSTIVGAKVVRDFIAGASLGQNIIDVETYSPAASITSDHYSVPVCKGIFVDVEVAA